MYAIRSYYALEWLQALPGRFNLSPSNLVLEITENLLLADTQRTQQWLESVRSMGFRVSMDDFGTGYSSLSYLKNRITSYNVCYTKLLRATSSIKTSKTLLKLADNALYKAKNQGKNKVIAA